LGELSLEGATATELGRLEELRLAALERHRGRVGGTAALDARLTRR